MFVQIVMEQVMWSVQNAEEKGKLKPINIYNFTMKGFHTKDEINNRQQEQQKVQKIAGDQKREIHIYGYKEWYIPKPDVDIYLDGEKNWQRSLQRTLFGRNR